MRCVNCGFENTMGAKFCEKCGTKMPDMADAALMPEPAPESASVPEKSKGKKRKGIYIAIASVLCVALLVGVGIWIFNAFGPAGKYDKQIKLGYELLEEGKYEEAIIAFDKAINIDKKKPEGYVGKATAMAHDEDMNVSVVKEIVFVIDEGYKKSKDKKIIQHMKKVADIIEGNGYYAEAELMRTEYNKRLDGVQDDNEELVLGINVKKIYDDIVIIDDTGIYTQDGQNQLIGSGKYSSNFAANSEKIYYIDQNARELRCVNTKSQVKTLAKLYPDEDDYGSSGLSASIDGCCGDYIYITEEYGPAASCPYYYFYNIETQEYCHMPQDFINRITAYKGKIYYTDGIIDGDLVGIYSSNPDGSDEKIIDSNGNAENMFIYNGYLYYSEKTLYGGGYYKDAKIVKIDLNTMKKSTVYTLPDSEFYEGFTNFGLVIRDVENQKISIIDLNGKTIMDKKWMEYSAVYSEALVLYEGHHYERSYFPYTVVTKDKQSEPINSGDSSCYYVDGKLYFMSIDYKNGGFVTSVYSKNVKF